jgi:hypothetical protein
VTRTPSVALVLAGVLAACNGPEPVPPPDLTDTGWFGQTTIEEPPPCEDQLSRTVPEEGADGWYWRDRPIVYTDTDVQEAYAAWIVNDATGARTDPELTWNEEGTSFTLDWDEHFEGDTDYSLFVSDCDSTTQVTFRTGPLGLPLQVSDTDLQGRTFLLDLGGARWVEPPVLAGLIQIFFTTPVLLGVRYVDDDSIDLLAAPGEVSDLGVVSQDRFAESWNFPIADFTEAPFVDASAPSIDLTYDSYGTTVAIPVTDFVLQGTFSADGTRLGGGVLEGFGDTRSVGALLGDDRPEAICELAAGAGVNCIPCEDTLPYCLRLRAEALEADWIPGLELVER